MRYRLWTFCLTGGEILWKSRLCHSNCSVPVADDSARERPPSARSPGWNPILCNTRLQQTPGVSSGSFILLLSEMFSFWWWLGNGTDFCSAPGVGRSLLADILFLGTSLGRFDYFCQLQQVSQQLHEVWCFLIQLGCVNEQKRFSSASWPSCFSWLAKTFDFILVRDAIIVSCMKCGTSFYAGMVIFSIIGFLAKEADLPVSEVITSGLSSVTVTLCLAP